MVFVEGTWSSARPSGVSRTRIESVRVSMPVGISIREVGDIMGISGARAQQLLDE